MAAMWRLTNIFVRPTDGTFETWRSELKFKSQRPGYGDLIHVWLELLKGPVEPVQLFQGAVQFLDMLNWATLVRCWTLEHLWGVKQLTVIGRGEWTQDSTAVITKMHLDSFRSM